MLGLTITPAAYCTLAGADFVTPIRPAPPVISPFASNVQVTEIMQVYNKSLWTFNKYVATAKALKHSFWVPSTMITSLLSTIRQQDIKALQFWNHYSMDSWIPLS
eukprot:3122662-Ditylum_brightwellii.AAC.1